MESLPACLTADGVCCIMGNLTARYVDASQGAQTEPESINDWYWLLGCAATAISAVGSITGMILQKVGYKKWESAPEDKGVKFFGMPMNRTWWLGFLLLVILPLPFDFIALGLASASLIYPFGASVTVICNQLIAPYLLQGEKMTRRDWIGSLVVILGCILTTAFGDHESKEFTARQILCLYGQPIFLVVLIVLSVMLVGAVVVTHVMPEKFNHLQRLAAVTYIPSYLCGVQTISFKSMSELTANSAFGTSNEWSSWPPWLFVFLVVSISVVQLRYMNYGAERFKATKFFPAYNATLMTIVVCFGAVFFTEYKAIHPVAMPIGLVFICAGIVVLTGKDPTDSSKVAVGDKEADSGKMEKGELSGMDGDENEKVSEKTSEKTDKIKPLLSIEDNEGSPAEERSVETESSKTPSGPADGQGVEPSSSS
eukprot:g3384.t1